MRLRRGRARGVRIATLIVLGALQAACWSEETVVREAPPQPVAEERSPPGEVPRVPRPEPGLPPAPIPPLQGAERPTESPLVAILDEGLAPMVEPPKLELPSSVEGGEEPTLALAELSQRLRDSDALGVFTKVALKNQIDDLLGELERFHEKGRGRLEKLRERYDSLVLKIMSLVQDEEPRLASEIDDSREGIWSLLADPEGFAALAQGELS